MTLLCVVLIKNARVFCGIKISATYNLSQEALEKKERMDLLNCAAKCTLSQFDVKYCQFCRAATLSPSKLLLLLLFLNRVLLCRTSPLSLRGAVTSAALLSARRLVTLRHEILTSTATHKHIFSGTP